MPFLLTAILLLATQAGCSRNNPPTAAPTGKPKIKVVATIFPLADITKTIGGERVEVTTLIPAGASPHTFELTPAQARNVAEADLVVKVGMGLDDFTDRITASVGTGLATVTITEGIELIAPAIHKRPGSEKPPGHGEGEHNAHTHAGGDPHVWLDPVLVREHIAPQIASALARISPADREYFAKNLADYQVELDHLHREIKNEIDLLSQRTLITFHSAWCYFARRYGLTDIVVEEFPGQEPPPRWIAEVVTLARENNAKIVVIEPQFNFRAADAIASELGGKVIVLDPLGAGDKPGYDTYVNMMRSNLTVLKDALR